MKASLSMGKAKESSIKSACEVELGAGKERANTSDLNPWQLAITCVASYSFFGLTPKRAASSCVEGFSPSARIFRSKCRDL